MPFKYIYKTLVICFIIFNIIFSVILYNSYIHLKKEIRQNANEIYQLLHNEHEIIQQTLNQHFDYYNYQTEYNENSFNYFAIGNSLTIIPEFGMGICSTKPDNDYFHLLKKYLLQKNKKIAAYPYNYAIWEINNNRNKTFKLLDVYLDKKLNLVTIQLGENVSDLKNFEQDLIDLINYIKQKAPEAQIIIIGDFWDSQKNNIRKSAAQKTKCAFADLSEIIGNKTYQSKKGAVGYYNKNETYVVNERMETHPNDKGMEYIANKIFSLVK